MAMLPDWLELCELFAAHGVEYLVVGGQAALIGKADLIANKKAVGRL